jgi:hypothetical protein
MPINMQGPWTVSVRSKELGSRPQRFTISGADTGNGTYAGEVATPPVAVTGNAWAITVEHDPGTGFVTSFDQITFPAKTAGQYHFDIQANDDNVDPVFDDLILTCSTPVTFNDYLIYGNASHYSDSCIFNPCMPFYLVIDTHAAFARALLNPTLRAAITAVYPDRVKIPLPGPIPDPPPFQKIVIPLRDQTALPTQVAQVFNVSAPAAKGAAKTAAGPAASPASSSRLVSLSANQPSVAFNRVAVSGLVDHFFNLCQTGPLAGRVLRFLEYDRSGAELAGGPYTGTGPRETLGACTTDRHGNYIFRFQRTFSQYVHEALFDVAAGEDVFTQILPDVIVQLLDPMRPGGFCYESAPYWNIPFLQQINICVPDDCAGRVPTACQGHHAIQSIGNIFIGDPGPFMPAVPNGQRVGYNNFLNTEGRITAKSAILGTPKAECAAWFGYLDLFACFLDHNDVTQYTIRFRPVGAGPWSFFTETYIHPQIAKIGIPGYSGDLVGPQLGVNLQIDGGPLQLAPAYLNIESDPAWVFTHRDRKAVITSSIYAPTYGSVEFKIEGYNAAGAKVAGAEDSITLYIDNVGPDFGIDDVSMGAQTGGDCALFNLHGVLDTALTVRFHANQPEGQLNDYGLAVQKGNIGGFAVDGSGGLLTQSYAPTSDTVCALFEGTPDDPVCLDGLHVTSDLKPHTNGWLDPVNQPFCTFAINLSCSVRKTNGYNDATYSAGTRTYLLGIQAS